MTSLLGWAARDPVGCPPPVLVVQGLCITPDLQLKFLAKAGTNAGVLIVSCLRWLNQWQPGHLGTMIVAIAHCLLTKLRMHRIRAMGGAAHLLSLLQSWSRQSTSLLLASENQELKKGSWELEADAVLSIVCGPQRWLRQQNIAGTSFHS